MAAVSGIKQMRAQPFVLIRAKAGQRRAARRIKIGLRKIISEPAHLECHRFDMQPRLPQRALKRHRRMQQMRPAPEREQLRQGLVPVARL